MRGVRRSFAGRAAAVLDGLDLDIPRGEVYALLGANGAGKTTAVRILATLLLPDSGTAEVAGRDVAADPAAVRRRIGLTGQAPAVDEQLTGRENLVMMARLLGFDRRSARARAEELLERFDLVEAAGRPARSYSGGMRRRLDLAATLVRVPEVLLLDEPTTGLDPRSRAAVWAGVRELAEEGATVLLTTQLLQEAEAIADRVGVLDGGALVAEGTAAELAARVGEAVVELRDDAGRVLASHSAGEGIAGLRAALDALDAPGVAAARVGIRQPSLDDVFFALTRRAGR